MINQGFKAMGGLFRWFVGWLLACWMPWVASAAGFYTVMTEEMPPFSMSKDGAVAGAMADVVRLLMEKTQIQEDIYLYPWSRAYNLMQTQPRHILFSVVRSSEREALFKWVGPVFREKNLFYKRRGSSIAPKNREEALPLKIGTVLDSIENTVLAEAGFTQLKPVTSIALNVKWLLQDRIDLYPLGVCSYPALMERLKLDPTVLEPLDLEGYTVEYSIAFSKDIPDSLVQKWQTLLNDLNKTGVLSEISQRYGGCPEPILPRPEAVVPAETAAPEAAVPSAPTAETPSLTPAVDAPSSPSSAEAVSGEVKNPDASALPIPLPAPLPSLKTESSPAQPAVTSDASSNTEAPALPADPLPALPPLSSPAK